jgi:hypothetical protein
MRIYLSAMTLLSMLGCAAEARQLAVELFAAMVELVELWRQLTHVCSRTILRTRHGLAGVHRELPMPMSVGQLVQCACVDALVALFERLRRIEPGPIWL